MAGEGFDGAKAGLRAVSQQTQWVNSQVSAGKLALDPDAAESAAKHCEDEARELGKLLVKADQIAHLDGLGNYASGKELTQRFEDKAHNGDSGAQDLIRSMQKELKKQADSFRKAAKDYQTTDEQNAEVLQRGAR